MSAFRVVPIKIVCLSRSFYVSYFVLCRVVKTYSHEGITACFVFYTHPEDILPFPAELQNDQDRRVRETIIHVLRQISYEKGCLEKVVSA